MPTAKDLELKPIDSKSANEFIRKHHYSGKVVNNSRLHIGVFLQQRLEGVMQFGASTDIRRTMGLVRDTGWNEFIELNRMAFSDRLPRNSESRALSVAMRLLRIHAPHLKWVISFADGTQSGDGAIYRASGFVLTNIKRNQQILRMPNGQIVNKKTLDNPNHMGSGGRFGSAVAREAGAVPLEGFQLRYIYFIDPTYKGKLTVPILPFSEIEKRGAGMYKGEKITRARADIETGGDSISDTGGANPTFAL